MKPDDLRNPARRSGYDHVGYRPGTNRKKPFQAQRNGSTGPGMGALYMGPWRSTAEEAAQDFCNYLAGIPVKDHPKRLRSAGHRRRTPRTPTDAEVALRKLQREAQAEAEGRQGYVYCVAEDLNSGLPSLHSYLNTDAGFVWQRGGSAEREIGPIVPRDAILIGARGVKIGYSVDPHARVAELQTGNPRKLMLVGYFEGTPDDEARIHRQFHKDNVLQEWFRPSRELLSLFAN